MRLTLLVAFALAWISACVGCGLTPSPQAAHRALAERLEGDTVAMVAKRDDGSVGVYCAGVWVSRDAFLTAGHCVADLGKPGLYLLLESLGDEDLPPWNPVGQQALFSQHGDIQEREVSYWTGRVVGFDREMDLGLVLADEPRPMHTFARVSESEIDDGDRVEIVGHPSGSHVWSYVEGIVSATRLREPNGEGNAMPTLQVQGAFSHGNSGGGAFDQDGNLIGIGSYIETSTNGMGFFVHRDAIRAFLRGT